MKKLILLLGLVLCLGGCGVDEVDVPDIKVDNSPEVSEPEIDSEPDYSTTINIELTDDLITSFAEYYSIYQDDMVHFQPYELRLLPEFTSIEDFDSFDYNSFVLYVTNSVYLSEIELTDRGSIVSAENFEKAAINIFGAMPEDFEYQDSSFYTFEDGYFVPIGFDIHGSTFYRLTSVSKTDDIYTATFDTFEFYEMDALNDLEESSQNMKNIAINMFENGISLDTNPFTYLIENIFPLDNYREILGENNLEITTITFKLSENEDYPLIYLSRENSSYEANDIDYSISEEAKADWIGSYGISGDTSVLLTITNKEENGRTNFYLDYNYTQVIAPDDVINDAFYNKLIFLTEDLAIISTQPNGTTEFTFIQKDEDNISIAGYNETFCDIPNVSILTAAKTENLYSKLSITTKDRYLNGEIYDSNNALEFLLSLGEPNERIDGLSYESSDAAELYFDGVEFFVELDDNGEISYVISVYITDATYGNLRGITIGDTLEDAIANTISFYTGEITSSYVGSDDTIKHIYGKTQYLENYAYVEVIDEIDTKIIYSWYGSMTLLELTDGIITSITYYF